MRNESCTPNMRFTGCLQRIYLLPHHTLSRHPPPRPYLTQRERGQEKPFQKEPDLWISQKKSGASCYKNKLWISLVSYIRIGGRKGAAITPSPSLSSTSSQKPFLSTAFDNHLGCIMRYWRMKVRWESRNAARIREFVSGGKTVNLCPTGNDRLKTAQTWLDAFNIERIRD